MRDFHDAKAMAQSLRTALQSKGVDLSHGECLNLVAKEFGLDDWNVLAAKIAGDQAPVQLLDAIPIIRIFEAAKAKEFYLDLGFKLDFEHRFELSFPLFAQVSRSNIVLHLSEHHGDGSPGIVVDIPMQGIEALHWEARWPPGCRTQSTGDREGRLGQAVAGLGPVRQSPEI